MFILTNAVYRHGRVYRDRRAPARAVPSDVLGGRTAVPRAAVGDAVETGPADGGDEAGQRERRDGGTAGRRGRLPRAAHHDAAAVREPVDRRTVGGQGVGAVGTADHGPGAETVAQPARVLLEPEQKQSHVLQKRELRKVPEHLRTGIQQRVLAIVADVQRVVSLVQRVLRRPQTEQDRSRGPDTGHDQPDRTDRENPLPVLVRRPQAAGHRENHGVQVHMVQEMGQLQTGYFPAVSHRLPDTQVPLSRRARVRVARREHMRQGHQQFARGVQPAGREERFRRVRERLGLFVRRPVRPAGRVDRTVARAGRRQDILLPAASAPEHQQGARPLRGQGARPSDPAHVAGRSAQRAGLPALVPDQESQPQAAKRTNTVQRLLVPEPVLVQLHSAVGHRRGDHAHQVQDVEGAHGRGDGQGAGRQERDPGVVQRQERLFPGRPDPHARLVQDHTQIHAHAAARVQERELHEAQPVREMFP